jgi:transcriptional regulator with XRE-family HTH domain
VGRQEGVHRSLRWHCGPSPRRDHDVVTGPFDLCGSLRRIRRLADLSQREFAVAAGLSPSAVAHAEAGTRDLPVGALARAAALVGLRLAMLGPDGTEVVGMDPAAVRDRSGRRFPAHLDTMYSDERPSRWMHRPSRPQPTYTYDRRRVGDESSRHHADRPPDHLLPQPGDSPHDRAAARRDEYWRRRADERERAFLAGEFAGRPDAFTCTCPPGCDELDDRSGPPVHTGDCPCSCDLA